MSWFEETLLLR